MIGVAVLYCFKVVLQGIWDWLGKEGTDDTKQGGEGETEVDDSVRRSEKWRARIMPYHEWKELLTQWSREIITSKSFAEFLQHRAREYPGLYTDAVLASGWLGYPGASEARITEAETRLGITLPPDYGAFLQVTNGWRWLDSFIPCLWPVEEIEWLRVHDPDIIEDWNVGWNAGSKTYGSQEGEEAVEIHEQKYLPFTLRISDQEYGGTAMLLLNPKIVAPAGEWEAWFFAHWVPGADVYPSFWDMMQELYNRFLYLESNKSN